MKSSLIISLQSAIKNRQRLAIIILFFMMLVASWQRWTQPLIDHGREMNLPSRILAGERLYTDVQFLYGPFAPHFNALLYRIFGIHLTVLKASGAVCAILILMMIFQLARTLMNDWESFLVAGLTLAICALKSTANYIQPYAYAALYSLVFALGSLTATVSYIKRRAERESVDDRATRHNFITINAVLAGSLAGLSAISKPEIALAALAAGLTAMIIESFSERKLLWRDAAAFAAPMVVILAVTYSIILNYAPLRVLLEDNHVLFTSMPQQLVYFNRNVSGLAQWPSSLWFSLAGIGVFAFWVGLCCVIGAIASRKQAEWIAALKIGLILAAAGALWLEIAIKFFNTPSDVTPFASAAFILPVFIGFIIQKIWKGKVNQDEIKNVGLAGNKIAGTPIGTAPRIRILLVISIFSLVSILRGLLNITATGSYTPFMLPALIIVYLYLLFRFAPDWLASTDLIRSNIRRVAMILIALLIVGMSVNSAMRLRRLNTFTVSSSRGSFITVPEIGAPLQAAIHYVEQRSGPDDYVLAAPQATTINFLAARHYPLREEIIHPGFLAGDKELDAVERIEKRNTPLILIANFDTSEFINSAFGEDYNQKLMRWIKENYHLAARFDSPQSHDAKLGDRAFFILGYERNQ